MYNLRYSFVLCIIWFMVSSIAGPVENTATIMEENGIVPDVIDVAPSESIEIVYPSGVSVNQGAELTPTQVKDQPTLKWNADKDTLYTLIMTDPDAPSRADPKYREVRHWLVINIPADDVNAGEAIFEYIGSGPPEGTGLHRYVFLVYKQSGKIDYDGSKTTNKSVQNRLSTSTKELISKYSLGNPIAGNFYQAQFDDYVPILHAQFKDRK